MQLIEALLSSSPPESAAAAKAQTKLTRSFRLGWARTPKEVAEAQRLRHRVFAVEMGARLECAPGTPECHDADAYDRHCDHLLVRAIGTHQHDEVIATCRVLSPQGAACAGSLYTSSEFDLATLDAVLPRTLEMGRVCVDAAWRNGMIVMALWQELGQRLIERGLDTLVGCCSVSLSDGGELASAMWRDLHPVYLLPPDQRVVPRKPFRLQARSNGAPARVPALIRGYLRCGGRLLGPPAHDEDFNTADFPMMLRLADIPSRYGKRIFRE